MKVKSTGTIENMDNYKGQEFKKAMRRYEGASFTLYIPEYGKTSGILKGACGYYQIPRYTLLCKIGENTYFGAYSAWKENVMQNYDEFEKQIEEQDFIEFGICFHKKMTGICVNNEAILSEGGTGYLLCALALIAGDQSKGNAAMRYALFAYDPTNHKYSKLNYYCIDKALFELIFEFTKKAGDSLEQH